RLSIWLGTYDFHAASADDLYREKLLTSVARQARHLARTAPGRLDGAPTLSAIKGLIYAAICLPDSRLKLSTALRLLWRELDNQVLSDGIHIQRRPSLHLSVLRDLIDLRSLICRLDGADAERAVERLQKIIDRMGPALRFYRHGDGRLASFNGGHEGDPVLIDAVLAQADTRGRPIRRAEDAGFERAVCGRATLIFDVGPPPPPGYRHGTHAGLLAFELSIGRERVVVNCGGVPGMDHPTGIVRVGTRGPLAQWRDGLRTTVAHTTVGVGDGDSVAIGPGLLVGSATPDVAIHRTDNQGAVLLAGRAEGYAESFDLVHHRTLYLTAAGDRLTGEDVLTGSGGHEFTVRFHLHPKVRASLVTGGSAILLRLPSGEGWRFKSSGLSMDLEESVYWATPSGGPRRTSQIVINGTTQGGATTVRWAFCREGASK
ncbi:MAG: heparinase II/III family protein, partial [Pseudomonadota bacterium]